MYFADMCSKSANYCFATKKNMDGILLLCDVSVCVAMLTECPVS